MKEFTIVTAFYLMKSKYNTDVYKEWISNFLKLNMNCVLITNDRTKKWMDEWVDLKNIHVFLFEMEEFITSKYDWKKQYDIDNEKNHTRELYMIWNEKINILKLAIEKNPYHTDWFLWCDMGSLRQSGIFESEDFTKSITLCELEQDKSYFFRLYDRKFHNPYFITNLDKYLCKQTELNMIQGGFILTNLKTYKELHREYYELLDKLYQKNLFIGKDQHCYLSLVLQSIITRVIEIRTHQYIENFDDVWFFVYPFILGKSKYRVLSY
jgi:hypothetical protein